MRDGHRVFIYEQPGTGDVFTIIDPALQLNQLEQVQRDVAALLEHGLNPPAPEPQPTAADAAPAAAPADGARARRSPAAQAEPEEPNHPEPSSCPSNDRPHART